MSVKKTLMQKYDMPVHHLDFAFVEKCEDAREMEKIVQILRSGEEGFYPDLTKCAEERLRLLRPESRLFRLEEKILKRGDCSDEDLKPIYNFTRDIQITDTKLCELKKAQQNEPDAVAVNDIFAPIRQTGKIKDKKSATAEAAENTGTGRKTERIKSTDYGKWDRYDADKELLSMDLTEERKQEQGERNQKLRALQQQQEPVEEQENCETDEQMELIKRLTDVELEKFAEDYRISGNEFFRTKEYERAIKYYSRAITAGGPNVTLAYNNRAISYIKLQKYRQAIEDCKNCLKMEPQNLKARLRLAEATYHYGKRREAFDLYHNVLELEPNHIVALKAIQKIREELGVMPPRNATRLQIQEEQPAAKKTAVTKQQVQPKKQAKIVELAADQKPTEDYDYAALIKPNRIVKSKLITAAETFGKLQKTELEKQNKSNPKLMLEPSAGNADNNKQIEELQLPIFNETKRTIGKLLIEEI